MGKKLLMIHEQGKVLGFGPFEPSIGNRLLANSEKVVPLGARAMASSGIWH